MSIRTSISISNSVSGLAGSGGGLRTPASDNGVSDTYDVTTDVALNIGSVTAVGEVLIKVISGDALLVGHGDGTYPFRITSAAPMLFPVNSLGLKETQTVTPNADVAGGLQMTYFTLEGESGTWAVWYNVAGGGTEPAHGKDFDIMVAISTGDNQAAVALATHAAMDASTPFKADFTIGFATPLITLTDKVSAVRANLTDGGTGFTLATTQQGWVASVPHLKSEGTSKVFTLVTSA